MKWISIPALLVLIVVLTTGCIEVRDPYDQLPPGTWRGVLYLDQQTSFRPGTDFRVTRPGDVVEKIPDNQLPFNFTVRYNRDGEMEMVFTNAEEELVVRDIAMGTDLTLAKDTLRVRFPASDNYLKAVFAENTLQGYWVVPSRPNYRVPFDARFGQNHRFQLPVNLPEPSEDLFDGQWSITFEPEGEQPRPAIAEFSQSGKHLTGTFITNTGDYRYLQGNVEDDKLWLSTFDGVFAFLIGAKIFDGDKLEGFFKSGSHYTTDWVGIRGELPELNDPLTMTEFESDRLEFEAIDLEGNHVSSSDFMGNPLVVLITGTWCPNCKDAIALLEELKEEFDFQVVGISFERHEEAEKALPVLRDYSQDLNLSFPLYFGGHYHRENAAKTMGIQGRINAFPTIIFLDSDHEIRGSYTGFSGPATSVYPALVQSFRSQIQTIISHE